MAFDALNRYTANHKAWDHVGNMIPDIEHSEGIRIAAEFKVAPWLPVQFRDKYYEMWDVIMPGKAVALDPDGCVMPAEYGLTGASVVYTQNDVVAGTIDIATGLPCEFSAATKTVVLADIDGTRDATWTRANAGTSTIESGFMGRFGVDFVDGTIKYPIGIAPYAYVQWCGGDGFNPAEYYVHNVNMQHQVAVLQDAAIKLPWIPAQAAAETVDKTVTDSTPVLGTANVHTRARTQEHARYAATTGTVPVADTDTVIAIVLDNMPVAKNTARTQILLDSTTDADHAAYLDAVLVNEVSSVAAVTAAGDYFIDYPVGVIFVYSANGATVAWASAAGTVSITYYHMQTNASVVSKFGCVVGALVAGDFLKVGANSNFVPADPASDTWGKIMGQVVAFETYPRDGLERVRTAYATALSTDATGSMANGVAATSVLNLGQMDQMAGSATGGVNDFIHYAGAADTMVIINLVSR